MARFTLEARTPIFTPSGRFPSGTTVTINLPAPATQSTMFTYPQFKNSIIAQFRSQGIDINPNNLGGGFWKVNDVQR